MDVPAFFSMFPIFFGGHLFAIFGFLEELIFEIFRHKACVELGLILPHQRVGAVFEQAAFKHKFLRLCALRIDGNEAQRLVIRSPDPVARLPRQFTQVPPQSFAMGNRFCGHELYQLLPELQNVHVGRGQTMPLQFGGAFAQPGWIADPLCPARICGFGPSEARIDQLPLQVPHLSVQRRRRTGVPREIAVVARQNRAGQQKIDLQPPCVGVGSDQNWRALFRRDMQVGQFQHSGDGLAHPISLFAIPAIEGRHRHIAFGKGHRHGAEPPLEGQLLQEPHHLVRIADQKFRRRIALQLEALSLRRLPHAWRKKVVHDPASRTIRSVEFVPADQHFPRRSKMAFMATVFSQSAEAKAVGIGVSPFVKLK
ncbi:MAG: hypothetical protein MRY81_11230 [Donghicola eburneus]|nr:hypothetical protein [Donghicola eburneus]MCI5040244.1 hypothetical protein [Donghicola eburneus]